MWREKPIVAAWAELVGMRDLHAISHLDLGTIGPLVLKLTQFESRVHSIVVELLFVNLILLVLKGEVQPVENVKHLDSLLE